MTISDHAKQRMNQKGITEHMVNTCIKTGKRERGKDCIIYKNKFVVVKISYDNNIITVQNSKTVQRGILVYMQKYGINKNKAAQYYYSAKGCYLVS